MLNERIYYPRCRLISNPASIRAICTPSVLFVKAVGVDILKKQDASRLDYENVKDILIRETGLPISLQHNYKFLMILPLERVFSIEITTS